MSPDRMTDGELKAYGEHFAQFAGENAAELGLSPEQVAELQARAEAFGDRLLDQLAVQNAARAATGQKHRAEDDMLALIRLYSNQWRANPSLPDALLQEGGIERRRPKRQARPVFAPTRFTHRTVGTASVRLQWERNGNANDTLFAIEARALPEGKWKLVTVTTRKSHVYTAGSIAHPVAFRVRAMRGDVVSDWCEGPLAFAVGPVAAPAKAA